MIDESTHSGSLPLRWVSEHLRRYRVIDALGAGGMGFVCLAEGPEVDGYRRPVALKILHPHLASERELVRQFIHEAKIAAQIRHPNVVAVLDVAREGDLVYLVMDYVDGISMAQLFSRVGRAGVPLRVGLRVLCDALAGLDAAHELRDAAGKPLAIVHRDVTPQNILINRAGTAFLSDFGVAKSAASTRHTRDGTVKGKIAYMAPEQARGRSVDRRADVWAAGVLAWEICAGKKLFGGKDDLELLMNVATKRPPRLSAVVRDIDPELERVIGAALARSAAERCPSARAFRDGLLAATGGVATDAEVALVVHEALAEEPAVAPTDEAELDATASSFATLASETHAAPRRRRVFAVGAAAAIAGAALATAANRWSSLDEERSLVLERFVTTPVIMAPSAPTVDRVAASATSTASVVGAVTRPAQPPARRPRPRPASSARPLAESPYEDR